MITIDHALHEEHPLPPFERASNLDPLTDVFRFLDRAVSSRATTFAMHFELCAPCDMGSFDFRRAFDRFLAELLGDLERDGYTPFCAWGFAGTSHAPMVRLLLLLDGSKPNSVAAHLRSAEHAWGVALGIADASGFVGYHDHRDADGSKIGNGVILNSGAESIGTDWTDCFRIAEMLVNGEEGEATGPRAVGFHVPGRNRSAAPSLRN